MLLSWSSLAFLLGLHMGAGKSKPKEPGQRSMSLDGTIGTGSDSGHFHHLGPAQQTQTPNRSPAVGTGRGYQGQHQLAPTNTPELTLFGGVDHTGTVTSPQRGPLSGRKIHVMLCWTGFDSTCFTIMGVELHAFTKSVMNSSIFWSILDLNVKLCAYVLRCYIYCKYWSLTEIVGKAAYKWL